MAEENRNEDRTEENGTEENKSRRSRHKNRHKEKARGTWICGILLTILLAAGVFLYGGPYMDAAREHIAAGVSRTLEYLKDNDRTGFVRRRKLFLKEEEKSQDIIKRNLGKDVMPPPDSEQ